MGRNEMLEGETLKSLREKYAQAGDKLEAFLAATRTTKDPNLQAARGIGVSIAGLLSKDMNALRHYDPDNNPKQEAVSLVTFLEDSRIETVGMGVEKFTYSRGAVSARVPMTIIGPDGQEMPGYFTKKKIYDPAGDINKVCKKAAASAKTPEGAEMLKKFYANYRDFYTKHPNIFDTPVGENPKTIKYLINNMKIDYADQRSQISTSRIVEELAQFHNMSEEDVRKACGDQALQTMKKGLQSMQANVSMNALADMKDNDRIDTRNSAMRSVAELMGMGDLICYAKPLKVKLSDGTEVEGTFMAEANGVDANHPSKEYKNVSSDSLRGTDGRALKQLADLQVLDFLCGNIDRHGGNMFYKFDENHKLIGIQGIDNDCSFGTLKGEYENVNFMTIPQNMMAIDKETADKVLALTEAQLAFTLRGQVEPRAIKGACERLKAMKEAITTSREMAKTDNTIRRGFIKELSGDEWAGVRFDDLRKGDVKNHFAEAEDTMTVIQVKAKYKPEVRKAPPKIGSENRATAAGVYGQLYMAEEMLQLLNDNNKKLRGTSAAYTAVQEAVGEYADLMNSISKRIKTAQASYKGGDKSPETVFAKYVTRDDMIKMQKGLTKIYETASTYYENKVYKLEQAGKKPNDYTKGRMDATEKIMKFAEKGLTVSAAEQKTLEQNTRRATESMMKKSGPKLGK